MQEWLEKDAEWKTYIEKRISEESTNQNTQNTENSRETTTATASAASNSTSAHTAAATWPASDNLFALYTAKPGNQQQSAALSCASAINNLRDEWIFDPAAAVHVCNDLSLFTELFDSSENLMTGDSKTAVAGVGTARMPCVDPDTGNARIVTLHDVRYSPNHHVNLISYSKTKERGCQWDESAECLRAKDGRPIA